MELNSRQYRFVINLLSGMSQTEAYRKAGYNVANMVVAATNASDLIRNNPLISLELKRLREKTTALVTASIASPTERKQILTELLRARLVDFLGESGEPTLTKATPNNRAAREFYHKTKVDGEGNPIVTKSIKLVDPVSAIQELNKMDGSYAPSKHQITKVEFDIQMIERDRQEEE